MHTPWFAGKQFRANDDQRDNRYHPRRKTPESSKTNISSLVSDAPSDAQQPVPLDRELLGVVHYGLDPAPHAQCLLPPPQPREMQQGGCEDAWNKYGKKKMEIMDPDDRMIVDCRLIYILIENVTHILFM